MAFVWGKRDFATDLKLRKRLQALKITVDCIATDHWESFTKTLKSDKHNPVEKILFMMMLFILSVVSVYFFVTGMHGLLNKNRKNIYLPDEDMNIFIYRLDKVTYFFSFISIMLGIFIFLITVCLYFELFQIGQNSIYLQIINFKYYKISILLIVSGVFLNLLPSDRGGSYYGSLSILKKKINDYYEIQNFKSRFDWVDYPQYSGYTKEYFLAELKPVHKVFYVLILGNLCFYLGLFIIIFSIFKYFLNLI